MDKRVFQTLEFDKIRERLAEHAASEMGKRLCERVIPRTDIRECNVLQGETEAAVRCILQWGNPPLFGICELRSMTHRASLGGSLSAGQLLAIAESLRVSRALIDYAKDAENDEVILLIRGLFVQRGLEESITDAIISEDEIADNASRTLFGLRRSIKAKQSQIKTRLNEIMMQAAKGGHLRENIVTMRDGRYVLPIRAESRRSFAGVVHDQSATGATVYIEPMAVVELNNEIRKLEVEEEEEIRRILADLSMEVGEYAEEIARNEKILQYLDFTFAKAKYALEIRAVRPEFSEERIVDFQRARHPLLSGKVVPIDIRLGEEFNTLVVTGPNTGGKTVTLKTLGLLTLMAQAGLHIPVQQPSRAAIFDNVYADIGDKQSIEMSLSTFSASMTNIVSILEDADEESLVLFDELGAGTDPTEGAALAMAILERLTAMEIRTVATTHYSELKLFAIREPRVQNASVEFDVETLSPTYRLMIGLPGRSNAFEIASRLGLSEAVLEDAQKHLDSENVQFEDVLADIEKERVETEKKSRETEEMRRDFNRRLEALKKETDKAKAEIEREREKAKEQARELVREAEETAAEMLREAKKAKSGDTSSIDRAMTGLRDRSREKQAEWAAKKKAVRRGKAPEGLKVGDAVEIVSMGGQKGVIIRGPDRKGDVQIQMGILKVNANVRDLLRTVNEEEEKLRHESRPLIREKKAMEMSMEIDLRGERLDEALSRVDKYLDDAILAGLPQVRIIHGKGTGALRAGIQEMLRHHRRVKKFEEADLKEGGAGVTVVTFR